MKKLISLLLAVLMLCAIAAPLALASDDEAALKTAAKTKAEIRVKIHNIEYKDLPKAEEKLHKLYEKDEKAMDKAALKGEKTEDKILAKYEKLESKSVAAIWKTAAKLEKNIQKTTLKSLLTLEKSVIKGTVFKDEDVDKATKDIYDAESKAYDDLSSKTSPDVVNNKRVGSMWEKHDSDMEAAENAADTAIAALYQEVKSNKDGQPYFEYKTVLAIEAKNKPKIDAQEKVVADLVKSLNDLKASLGKTPTTPTDPVDKDDLADAIITAEDWRDQTPVDTGSANQGEVPQAAMTNLENAITAARSVLNNANATQAQVDTAESNLRTAISNFTAAIIT